MALVSLTVDGSSFSLEESDVVKVYELSSEVKVEYLIEKLGITKTVVVAESVSTINGLSDLLISLTDTVSGSTFLLNSKRVSDVFTEGTGAKINYDVANFTQSVVVDESVSAVAALYPSYEPSVSYKVYRALLTQTGTNAPVATVLENTLGLIPTYSYQDVGSYALTAPLSNPNPFTENKTTLDWTNTYFTLFGGSILTENRMNAVWSSTSQILISTVDGTTATNDILNTNQWWIEIIVYD
jgi:hypothetical protein